VTVDGIKNAFAQVQADAAKNGTDLSGGALVIGHGKGMLSIDAANAQQMIADGLKNHTQVYLYADGDYSLNSALVFPGDKKDYKLSGFDGQAKITPGAGFQGDYLIKNNAEGGNISLNNLEVDLAGKDVGAVQVTGGTWTTSELQNLKIHNSVEADASPAGWKGAISVDFLKGQTRQAGITGSVKIHDNDIYNVEGVAIHSYTDAFANQQNNQIYNNNIHDSALTTVREPRQPAKIDAHYANIHDNVIYNCKYDSPTADYTGNLDAYAVYGAIGINAYNSEIKNNQITGVGDGIVPGGKSNVDGNTIRFSAVGINYWYSSGTVVQNNTIFDCSAWGPDSWDSVGIDLADHSSNTKVINNHFGNQAGNMTANITAQGQNWINVDSMNGNKGVTDWAPNEWITIGGKDYMISSIDKSQNRVYVETAITGQNVGGSITGVNKETWGVGIGNNANWNPSEESQKGYHYVAGNTYTNMVHGGEGETNLGPSGTVAGPQVHSYFDNYKYNITDPNDPKQLGAVPNDAIGKNITLVNGSIWQYQGAGKWIAL
jgi:parallel beta-helix repeat protein